MTTHSSWISNVKEVGQSIRRPEALAKRWNNRVELPEHAPDLKVFGVLLATAVVGVALYGMIMHIHHGPGEMVQNALLLPMAAGGAWSIALPSLYIIKRLFGSELDYTTLLLVALITVSFGSMAMLASAPVTLFFELALPYTPVRVGVNLLVFGGVGFCMGDVLMRTVRVVEPDKTQVYPILWLGLLTLLGAQLMWLFGVFDL